ncbi:zinc finger protein 592 [Synchiropus picturatus]
MGDMKTPDFDDLLAAFDIPDATGLDAKESIRDVHEETESHLKHSGLCVEDGLLATQAEVSADLPAVSVIVKNTSRQESLEGFAEGLHGGSALQNGFSVQSSTANADLTVDPGFTKSFISALNGASSTELLDKVAAQQRPDVTPVCSQSPSYLSPVSSPESEGNESNKNQLPRKKDCFSELPVLVNTSVDHSPRIPGLCMYDEARGRTTASKSSNQIILENRDAVSNNVSGSEKRPDVQNSFPHTNSNRNSTENNGSFETTMDVLDISPCVKSQAPKLSSCLEALVALNAKKDLSEPSFPRDPAAVHSDSLKHGSKVPISPHSPRSPLEAVKRLMKPPDSPMSICSDSSGKVSPAVISGSPAAIPRVRIKTIKTTSGQIKRTVTSVLPESETDELHSTYESSPSQSLKSEDSFCNVSPHPSQSAALESPAEFQSKESSVRIGSPKVMLNRADELIQKATATESSRFRKTHKHGKKSGVNQKPKRMLAANSNFLPKAVHLASLNLVPHSVAASVSARSSSQQQSQHALSPTVYSTVPLVHQVKTANSLPPSSVPNTATGTLNRLLNNTNPVPTYVPNLNPPQEFNISLPKRGYCCLECGDSFSVERSLSYHYSRRSVHIEVGCMHCAKTMVFFNKCALLAHAREHKLSGTVMQCTQLHMKPIAQEQMFVPLSTDPLKVAAYTSTAGSVTNQPVMPLYPDNVIRQRFRCLECNKQLPDHKALAGHYQNQTKDNKGLICKVCMMLLPNKCSFRAHQRIHAHKSPFICPECGGLSRSGDIQKHIKENCLHYTRKAWYKCLHCDVVFKTLTGQKSHIEEKHCEVFYKCSVCPVAFKTSDGCEVHLKRKHNASKISPKLIFKCSCEKIFKKKALLVQHFHHDANKRVTCVFKCPECNSVFSQKHLLVQHFKSVHGGDARPEMEEDRLQTDVSEPHAVIRQKRSRHGEATESPKKRAESESRTSVKPTGWTCGECLQRFPERDQYISHVKKSHGKSMKRYPCRVCEQSFNSTTSLKRHIRVDHSGKKKIYSCWYCTDVKKTFTTSVTLKNHISLMHGIKNPDLAQMPKTSVQELKRSRGKGMDVPPAGGGSSKDHEGSLEAPTTKRLKSQYRCSKCGYTTDDGAQFQQHIPQHKTDQNTPQCLHCGLCFTSPLSLSRHLFIVHKVKEEEKQEEVSEKKSQSATAAVTDDSGDSIQGGSELSQT